MFWADLRFVSKFDVLLGGSEIRSLVDFTRCTWEQCLVSPFLPLWQNSTRQFFYKKKYFHRLMNSSKCWLHKRISHGSRNVLAFSLRSPSYVDLKALRKLPHEVQLICSRLKCPHILLYLLTAWNTCPVLVFRVCIRLSLRTRCHHWRCTAAPLRALPIVHHEVEAPSAQTPCHWKRLSWLLPASEQLWSPKADGWEKSKSSS